MQLNIKIKNLKEFQRTLKKAPEITTKEFGRALNKLSMEIERKAVLRARALKIHSTGNLIKQIKQKKISKLSYAVISNAEYSIFVEKGRRPGKFPPYKPLFEWVQRHYRRFSGRGSKGNARAITFLIQRKIARKGIKARPYMQWTWDKMQRRADKIFDKALDNVIKKIC